MPWIWLLISSSLPVILAVSIIIETVQRHTIWTILYRSSLIALIYGCVIFLIGLFILAYLRPLEKAGDGQADQPAAEKPAPKKTATNAKTTARI